MTIKVSGEKLFFGAYFIYLFLGILSTSFYLEYLEGTVSRILISMCILILVAKESICSKVTTKMLVGLVVGVVFVLFIIFSANGLGYNSPIYMMIFIFAGRNIDFKKKAKFTIVWSSILLLFIILSSVVGVIPNYTISAQKGNMSYLGFRYSLYPATLLSNCIMLYLYIKSKKIKYFEIIGLIIVNYVMYALTISRLIYYFTTLILLYTLVKKLTNDIVKVPHKICLGLVFSYIVSFAFSFFTTLTYNNQSILSQVVNYLTEGRLKLQYQIITHYGLGLLGKKIIWRGSALDASGKRGNGIYFYVDSMYLNITLMYGMIITLGFIIAITYSMYIAYKKNDDMLIILLSILAVHGIVDDLVQYLYYNTFLFILTSIYKKKEYTYVTNKSLKIEERLNQVWKSKTL